MNNSNHASLVIGAILAAVLLATGSNCNVSMNPFDLAGDEPGGSDGGGGGGGVGLTDDSTICWTFCGKYAAQNCRGYASYADVYDAKSCFNVCIGNIQAEVKCRDAQRTWQWCVAGTDHLCAEGAPVYTPGCDDDLTALRQCIGAKRMGDDGGLPPAEPACLGLEEWEPCVTADYQGYCFSISGLRTCVMGCVNPGATCPLGTCYPVLSTGWSACMETGTRQTGEACSRPNDCAAGAMCVQWGADQWFVCHQICSDSVPCATGDCVVTDDVVKLCAVTMK